MVHIMRKLPVMTSLFACATFARAEGLPVSEGLILDLDASDVSSLTLNGDVVQEWRSQVGEAPSLKAGKIAYPDAKFKVGDVRYTTERGKKGLLFSHYDETDTVYSLMSFGDNVQVSGKTFVIVTRQIDESGSYGAIMGGRPLSYSERLMRDRDTPCMWYNANYGNLYINGTFSNARTFSDVGGTSCPHVLAVRHPSGKAIEMFGAAYVMYNESSPNDPGSVYDKCVIFEVLVYDRELSDAQIAEVGRYLSAKWIASVWTGAAETDDWNDADNWEYGFKPTEGATAVFTNSASCELSGDICCGEIKNASSGRITLTFKNDTDIAVNAAIQGEIDLIKQGVGVLTLAAGQKYSGSTTVEGGSLALPKEVIDYSQIPGLVAHLDASRAETLVTNGKGEVIEWRSATAGGTTFAGANEAYPDGRVDGMAAGKAFAHGNPLKYTGDAGRAAVRFGFDVNGNAAGTFITPKDKLPISPQTFFFVQTQKAKNAGTGLLGRIGGYAFRLCRGKGADYSWASVGTVVMDKSWQNGRQGGTTESTAGDSGRTFEKSGTDLPNLLVVRNSSARQFEIIGGQYLYDTGTGNPTTPITDLYIQMDLHEALMFNGMLTDEQIATISAQLMDKWGVPRQADVYLADFIAPDADIEIAEGATLDLGYHVRSVGSIGGAGTLAFEGALGVTGASSAEGALTIAANGAIDLAGGSLVIGSWTGKANVVNSSATTGKLVLDTDIDVFLDCRIDGDIAVEKRGAGAVSMPPGQNASGATTLGGGALRTDIGTTLARYGKMSLHVDASRPETLVLDQSGNVLKWNSLTDNGFYLNNAHDAYPDARFRTAYSHLVADANGRPCVRFSYNEDSVHTGAVMAISSELTAQTLFFVNRQHDSKNVGGIIGDLYSYDERVHRNNNAAAGAPETMGWKIQPVRVDPSAPMVSGTIWVSGRKTADFGDSSGTTGPHVLAVRCDKVPETFEIVGACWPQDGGPAGSVNPYASLYSNADIYEIVAYESRLTDEQIMGIMELLVAKWSVETAEGVVLEKPLALAANTDVVVSAPTELGLWGLWAFDSLTFDVGGATVSPALSLVGGCDVTETPLVFLNADKVGRCGFLEAGMLVSPFASVTGLSSGARVTCRPSRARISVGGFSITIR